MSEEFNPVEGIQEAAVTTLDESQSAQEVQSVVPGVVSLFTEGIKLAVSRLDVIGVVFVTTLIMGILSVLVEYTASAELNIAMVFVSVSAAIVGVVNSAVLVYIFANSAQHPRYYDGVRWLGRNFFPYVWLALCVSFLKLGGFMLLIIPGLILSVYAAFSMMVFAAEDTRGFAAIMRSRQLAYGRFWKIVGVFSLLSVVMLLTLMVVMLVGGTTTSFFASEALVPILVFTTVFTALQTAGSALATGLVAHMYRTYVQMTPVQGASANVRKKYIVIAWAALLMPILGILMSVVLASLNSAQDTAQAAVIRMKVVNMRATAEINAELDAEGNALYGETCEVLESSLRSLEQGESTANCNDSVDAYAVEAPLTGNSYYCVDSIGFAGEQGSSIGVATSCE